MLVQWRSMFTRRPLPAMGRIAVLVALESTGDREVLHDAGRKLAMHIAASRPEAVTTEA